MQGSQRRSLCCESTAWISMVSNPWGLGLYLYENSSGSTKLQTSIKPPLVKRLSKSSHVLKKLFNLFKKASTTLSTHPTPELSCSLEKGYSHDQPYFSYSQVNNDITLPQTWDGLTLMQHQSHKVSTELEIAQLKLWINYRIHSCVVFDHVSSTS